MRTSEEIVEAITEMMAMWIKVEAAVRHQFPDASDEAVCQIVGTAMNKSLGLSTRN